jgi:hypothetical protein
MTLLAGGCVSTNHPSVRNPRAFDLQQDSFSYANELVWNYHFDGSKSKPVRAHPEAPPYTHHCFVVARAARQFFQFARFDPSQPVADAKTYRKLIRRVVGSSPRGKGPPKTIVIPGYANLREFSVDQGELLKAECGGAWQSYFQRGHWRMLLPLTRGHQDRMARQLVDSLGQNWPPVVHIVRFPQLTINHAILLFGCRQTGDGIEFSAYDPNSPEEPVVLRYDRAKQTFFYPRNYYFRGGRVDIYQIYHQWNY